MHTVAGSTANPGEEDQFPHSEQDLEVHRWFSEHEWVLDIEKIARLKDRSSRGHEPVFLCGVALGIAKLGSSTSMSCVPWWLTKPPSGGGSASAPTLLASSQERVRATRPRFRPR